MQSLHVAVGHVSSGAAVEVDVHEAWDDVAPRGVELLAFRSRAESLHVDLHVLANEALAVEHLAAGDA